MATRLHEAKISTKLDVKNGFWQIELDQEPVSRKSRKLFGPEKPFVIVPPAYSVKLFFLYVVKGIKIKITAKFRASRRLSFEDTKRIMSPEIRPKSFGTFEKQAPGVIVFDIYYTIWQIPMEEHAFWSLLCA